MNRLLRIGAAVFIVASGVALFATDNTRLVASLLIIGNLLSLGAQYRDRQS